MIDEYTTRKGQQGGVRVGRGKVNMVGKEYTTRKGQQVPAYRHPPFLPSNPPSHPTVIPTSSLPSPSPVPAYRHPPFNPFPSPVPAYRHPTSSLPIPLPSLPSSPRPILPSSHFIPSHPPSLPPFPSPIPSSLPPFTPPIPSSLHPFTSPVPSHPPSFPPFTSPVPYPLPLSPCCTFDLSYISVVSFLPIFLAPTHSSSSLLPGLYFTSLGLHPDHFNVSLYLSSTSIFPGYHTLFLVTITNIVPTTPSPPPYLYPLLPSAPPYLYPDFHPRPSPTSPNASYPSPLLSRLATHPTGHHHASPPRQSSPHPPSIALLPTPPPPPTHSTASLQRSSFTSRASQSLLDLSFSPTLTFSPFFFRNF
ncbi:hypothetical protein Pcinc_039087 [Petrolisthes cinctipes]|uniref:Uncharacterized protein n=1 Tax=Petrolisthes cinctipes TaxID=88211 RepID=A0AAE1EMA2_PETCI|nr:hypothetical protein Pcinc_039087 [Petrolisthes cinctipes]